MSVRTEKKKARPTDQKLTMTLVLNGVCRGICVRSDNFTLFWRPAQWPTDLENEEFIATKKLHVKFVILLKSSQWKTFVQV